MVARGIARRAIVLLLGAAILAGCNDSAPKKQAAAAQASQTAQPPGPRGVLRFGTDTGLNDWEILNKPGETYVSLLFEGLVDVAPDGHTLIPRLAASWEQTPGALIFTLRPGVIFHDGEPFNAQAVVANFERVRATKSQYAAIFEAVSTIRADGDLRLVLELKAPAPTLLQNLAARGVWIISPKALANNAFLKQPAGTGPWIFNASASQYGSKIVVDAFDKYYAREEIGPARIEILMIEDPNSLVNALITGQVDIATVLGELAKTAETQGFTTASAPTLLMHLLMLDRNKTFADENVRKAICAAIDPKAWIDTMFAGYGKVVSQRLGPGLSGHHPALTGYKPDLDKARAYLKAAGAPQVAFTFPVYPRVQQMGQLLKAQLAQIGVSVTVELLTTGQYFSFYQSDKYPAQINTSASEGAGAYDYYRFRFAREGTGNPFRVQDSALDALAAKALVETDPKMQEEGWRAVVAYLEDKALDCGFFEQDTVWAYNPKKIERFAATAMKPSVFRYRDVRLRN